MALDLANTVLSTPPYSDDYKEEKRFHRILFRPGTAIQARELTQLQTILQNQVERFGDYIFKTGTVIKGCAITHIPDLKHVAVRNQFINNPGLSIEDAVFNNGVILVGNTSGVQATVLKTVEGFESSSNPSKFFIKYTAPSSKSGTLKTEFETGEQLIAYKEGETYVGSVKLQFGNPDPYPFLVGDRIRGVLSRASGLIRSIETSEDTLSTTVCLVSVRGTFEEGESVFNLADTSLLPQTLLAAPVVNFTNELARVDVANTFLATQGGYVVTGDAYAVHSSEGVIYQKGFFIRTEEQLTIVNPSSANPAGKLVGFETKEEIITEFADVSLYDNAAGSTNENAPGAHRLRLTPELVVYDRGDVPEDSIFFSIIEYGKNGAIFQNTEAELNKLGQTLAKRTFEESGDYIVRPFRISSEPSEFDQKKVMYNITPGLAYVKGFRIESLSNIHLEARRGIDTLQYDNQIVTTTYGNYIEVKELRGFIPDDESKEVHLYDTVQAAITGNSTTDTAVVGAKLGTANVRNVVFMEGFGTKGAPTAKYRIYLFNIKMDSATDKFSDVKSIYLPAGGGHAAFADVILQDTKAVILEGRYVPMLFSLSAQAVNSVTNAEFFFTNVVQPTEGIGANGTVTADYSGFSADVSFGFTDTSTSSKRRVDLFITGSTIETDNLPGTVETFGTTVVTGTSTTFQDDFLIGESIKIAGVARRIVAINSNTDLEVDANFSGAAGQTYRREHNKGSIISLDTPKRTISFPTATSLTINIGANVAVGDANSVATRIYSRRTNALALQKNISRNKLIKLYTGNLGTASANLAGTIVVGANTTTVVGSGTAFLADFEVGGAIKHTARPNFFRRVVEIANNTHMTVNAPWLDTNATSGVVTSPELTAGAYFRFSPNDKYNLGLPDVLKVNYVYTGAKENIYNTKRNIAKSFILDDGQRDTHYDHSSIKVKSAAIRSVIDNRHLLVSVDVFEAIGEDRGYFSVASYPIDDSSNPAANTIQTVEVPSYFSTAEQKLYDLRDTIDFRPYRTATANVVGVIQTATLNPTATNTFNELTTVLNPLPGQNFECDFSQYLPRRDLIVLSEENKFHIVEGASSLTPRLPTIPSDALDVAEVFVPAYPSITDVEYNESLPEKNKIKLKLRRHKRFTMREISTIEQRLSSVEYYTALSLLETSAASLSIPSADGTNRFKNGIFVESFSNLTNAGAENSCTVDPSEGVCRPSYVADNFGLRVVNSVGASITSKFATTAYTDLLYLEQNYATEPVIVVPDINFNGIMEVEPVEFRDVYQDDVYISGGTVDQGTVAPTTSSTSTVSTTGGFELDEDAIISGHSSLYYYDEK